MSGGVVCYVERSLGGAVITRMRLVAAGLNRTWTAPAPEMLAEGAPAADSASGGALAASKAAAAWIADSLASLGLRRLACICLDPDGSVCAWLTAPSPDQAVIEASITQGALDAGGGDGAGLGAGRLLAMAAASSSGLPTAADTSIQALADETDDDLDPDHALVNATPERGARAAALKLKSPAKSGSRSAKSSPARLATKSRYAVLAVPDVPVRVLLDELDQRAVEVGSVVSLWHAMARAWDEPEPALGPLVSAPGVRASVIVDPAGRLVWAWSRAGLLLAGGTMKLTARRDVPPPPPSEPPTLPEPQNATRRIADNTQAPSPGWEFSKADAGRLAMDWLAWSVQLGACPSRVLCISTPNVIDSAGGTEGAAVLGRAVAGAWSGATLDATDHPDPIGATIARIAGLGHDGSSSAAPLPLPEVPSTSARAALVPLGNRPGRADRARFRWMGIALAMAAVVIGALGWQLGQAADKAQVAADAAKAKRAELLVSLESLVPNLSKERDPVASLETRIRTLRESAAKIRPPRPVLAETLRVLKALEAEEDVRVAEFDFNSMFNAKVTLLVPDAESGPRILEKLRAVPGELPWTGTIPTFSSGQQRQYILLGVWPTDAAQPGAGGAR